MTIICLLTSMVILRSRCLISESNFPIPTWWHGMLCIAHLWWRLNISEDFVPFLQKLERSTWQHAYIFYIRRAIQSDSNYQLVRCLPDIQNTSHGDRFLNFAGPDGYTTLSTSVICWLMNIQRGYLVFHQGDTSTIKLYLPNRFAHQFGYDQLYVGKLNTGLHFSENLFEGGIGVVLPLAGGTWAMFNLP